MTRSFDRSARPSAGGRRTIPIDDPSSSARARGSRALSLVLPAVVLAACNARTPHPEAAQVREQSGSEKPAKAAAAHGTLEIGPAALKLATWNLEWLNAELEKGPVKRSEADYARLRKYAERLDADVIAFQEVDGEAAAARVFTPEKYALYVAEQAIAQRTGFAVRKTLPVTRHRDYQELDVGGVRAGTDITVALGPRSVRLLSVHLKSGCFDEPLTDRSNACKKLRLQLPKLEAWIDARAAEGTPFAVLGDFNRRLFVRPDEPFWKEIDDATPPEADLTSAAEGQTSKCWGKEYAHFVDHIVLSKSLRALVKADSFAQHVYDAGDQQKKSVLSDHCPLSVVLLSEAAAKEPASGARTKSAGADQSASGGAQVVPASDAQAGEIKGNIGSGGKKLYHLHTCPNYLNVKIDPKRGERTFVTEAEANAAGWTKAPDCP